MRVIAVPSEIEPRMLRQLLNRRLELSEGSACHGQSRSETGGTIQPQDLAFEVRRELVLAREERCRRIDDDVIALETDDQLPIVLRRHGVLSERAKWEFA